MPFDSEQDEQTTPEMATRAAEAITDLTPSASIYETIYAFHQLEIDPSRALGGISAKTGLPLDGLRDKSQFLACLAAITDNSLACRLAKDTLIEAFAYGLHLRTSRDRTLRAFNQTHWEPISDHQLRQLMTPMVLRDRRYDGAVSALAPAIQIIKDFVPPDDDLHVELPERVINTRNVEIVVADDGELTARIHRPEHALRAVLPVVFNKNAVCPRFDGAVAEMLSQAREPKVMSDHLMELFGHAIQPRRDIPVILYFWGAGSNGKSTLLEVLKGLVGRSQVWSGKINALTQDRFILPNIEGCLIALEDDGEQGEKIKTGVLKMISEHKPIDTRRVKSTHGTSFNSMLMPIIATNGAPLIEDVSYGFQRRLFVVPFNRQFKPEEMELGLAKHILEHELPGVLNRCIAGLQSLRARGHFARPPECVEARATFMNEANAFAQFLDEQCTRAEGETAVIAHVFGAFRAWTKAEGIALPFGRNGVKPRLQAMGFVVRKSSAMVVDDLKIGKASASPQPTEPPAQERTGLSLTGT